MAKSSGSSPRSTHVTSGMRSGQKMSGSGVMKSGTTATEMTKMRWYANNTPVPQGS